MTRVLALLLALSASPWLGATERVVSLAPSLSEIMLELNAKELLVGVLDGGERPASLAAIPSVGRMGQLEMESLLALPPSRCSSFSLYPWNNWPSSLHGLVSASAEASRGANFNVSFL